MPETLIEITKNWGDVRGLFPRGLAVLTAVPIVRVPLAGRVFKDEKANKQSPLRMEEAFKSGASAMEAVLACYRSQLQVKKNF